MGKPLILGGKPTLPLDSQSQCFLFTVQLLWSYDYSKWVIFTKNRILQWKILPVKPVKCELKIFAPNYQKAHPYAKSGRTNRLAYVAVTLYTTSLPRRRENVTLAEKLNANMQMTSVRSLITIFVTEIMMNMTWIKTCDWLQIFAVDKLIETVSFLMCSFPYTFISFERKKWQPGRKPGRQPGRMPFSQVIWPGAPWPRAATVLSQLKISEMFLRHFVAYLSNDHLAKFYEDRPRETPPTWVKRMRGSHI